MTSHALIRAKKVLKTAHLSYPATAVARLAKSLNASLNAIDTYIDRPEEEKDVLRIVLCLVNMPQFTMLGSLPNGYDQYGSAVKSLMEELQQHKQKSNALPVSRDAAQVYYAWIFGTEQNITDSLKTQAQNVDQSLYVTKINPDETEILGYKLDNDRRQYEHALALQASVLKLASGQPRLEKAALESQQRQAEFCDAIFNTMRAKVDAYDPLKPKTAALKKPRGPQR